MKLKHIKKLVEGKDCEMSHGLGMIEIMNIFSGKWRMPIIGIIRNDKLRYTDIQQMIPDITPRMLSKELRELEINGIVIRTVHNTIPVKIEYSLSESARELENVFMPLLEWSCRHRAKQLGK